MKNQSLLRINRMLQAALLVLGSFALSSLGATTRAPGAESPSEDDWWLPAWSQPLPGRISFYGAAPAGFAEPGPELKVYLRWKDVNPADGVYDWSALEKALATATRPIYMRFEHSHVEHVPQWIATKYPELAAQLLHSDPYKDNFGQSLSGSFYRPWHPGLESEFVELMQEFQRRRFANHPRFAFMYFPGLWEWGEYSVQFVDEMVASGMTPQDYLDWNQRMIDTYVAAFGPGNAHKLMYTQLDYLPLTGGRADWTSAIGRKPFAYAVSKGVSVRFGLFEKYDFLTGDMPEYGVHPVVDWNGTRRFGIDESTPLMRAGRQRWIATENEEWGNSNIPVSSYHQLKMTALRTLSLRANLVFTNQRVWQGAPALHEYLRRSIGKSVAESADAWAVLRDGRDQYQEWSKYPSLGYRGQWRTRNWERWLYQKDVQPGGMTFPAYRSDSPVPFNNDAYEAIRTDAASGNRYIYFDVDDRFISGNASDYYVKVTYLDDAVFKWNIHYMGTAGTLRGTSLVNNVGDGKWKTATFTIRGSVANNLLKGGSDIRINAGSAGSLTVRFVRVVKM